MRKRIEYKFGILFRRANSSYVYNEMIFANIPFKPGILQCKVDYTINRMKFLLFLRMSSYIVLFAQKWEG